MTADSPPTDAAANFNAWQHTDIERVRSRLHQDVDFVGSCRSQASSRNPAPLSTYACATFAESACTSSTMAAPAISGVSNGNG